MRGLRFTKTVTARVTKTEYERIVETVGDRPLSDWARDRLTKAAATQTSPQLDVLHAEVLALRRILLNIVTWSVSGKAITAEALNALIIESDAKKMDLVRSRVEG